jgi:AcrR family transcriptional regulator
MSDIMEATGLTKGGIYNHFRSKDELAAAAFSTSLERIRQRLDSSLDGIESASERLLAMMDVFASNVTDPSVAGGCPIFNTAVDADDTHPTLKALAASAMERWHSLVKGTVRKGISRGEFRSDADADSFATVFIASLEGAIVLSRIQGDHTPLNHVTAFIRREIQSLSSPS